MCGFSAVGAVIHFHFCLIIELLKIIRQCEQRSGLFMFKFHVSSSRFCWPSSMLPSVLVILVLCQSALGRYAAMAICIRFLCLCLCSAFIWIWVFITALPRSFHPSSRSSAECLLLITHSLWMALLSVRHQKFLLFSLITSCFCCRWPFVFWTPCGHCLPREGQVSKLTKMTGWESTWEGIDQSLHEMALKMFLCF